ncbi:MAG: helix-turn-helix transcriptional regulator [Flavobacteriales bacterium]|nr:helix-turn-helix transcriptional regulator [Flavobacteriales bacterium]
MPLDRDIFEFFKDVANKLGSTKSELKKETIIDDELFNKNECYYIFDLQTNELIESKGFDKLLGYDEADIDLEFIYNLYSPDESDIMHRITKSAVSYCLSKPTICEDAFLQTNFRIMRNDGEYIRVVSHAKSFSSNEQGYLSHFIIKLTDISFIDSSHYVRCFFSAKDLDTYAFRKQVFSAYQDFFTKREIEIIKEIVGGLSNVEIADKLFISKHTVITHRKNILRKSNQSTTESLIIFCKERGIV